MQLSENYSDHTRDRCPSVVFTAEGQHLSAIRTDETEPELPLFARSVNKLVLYDDALSRSIDEEAWIAEFARVIEPGGHLHLTLPAEGPLGWMDAMNIYRYFADITKRGDAPDAALPTGWNRHYTREHARRLLHESGFEAVEVRRQSYVASELAMLAGFVGGNWIRGDRTAEARLFPKLGKRDPEKRSGILATTWSIIARKK